MKKGDCRKQAILEAAQQLFFDKGYEQTSLQDILDVLHLSKGGFYHHFESKQQLLETICRQRAQDACQRGIEACNQAGDNPEERLNTLFRTGGFFGEDSLKYMLLLFDTLYSGSFSHLREQSRQAEIACFVPVVKEILTDGMDKDLFYPVYPECTAKLVVMLAINVMDEVAYKLARSRERVDMGEIMELLGAYRTAVERTLNARYGSIELVDMERVAQVATALERMRRRT